jgi:23S rRNA (pseudouridine1915-N3)-methyltransferase
MIQLIIVSDWFSHFEKVINEYIKRLNKLKIIKIKSEKSTEKARIISEETKSIKQILEKEKWYNIYLDILWESLSSLEFHNTIEKLFLHNPKINIIIWGAYWVDYKILNPLINKKLSLSKMTFPHSMSLLIILEQIYRIENIKKNTWYHH